MGYCCVNFGGECGGIVPAPWCPFPGIGMRCAPGFPPPGENCTLIDDSGQSSVFCCDAPADASADGPGEGGADVSDATSHDATLE
jgi:hypothetical protein